VRPAARVRRAPRTGPRGDGERGSPLAACLGYEGGHRDEQQDLQQERAAGAGVVVAVQFVVQAAIGPGDPHQREHRGELAESGPGQVLGQVVGGLRDQHDHGQVIEELKRADHALTRLLAMRAGRLPQGTPQPSPELCAGCTLG
jgi:hypothetical protein